jgi:hypothetical protein
MPEHSVSLAPPSQEIRQGGKVVGITDRIYPIDGDSVTFNDVLIRGDLSGELEYNGRIVQVERVHTIIGMEVGPSGPRGPVWKGVQCRVLR